jgi:hypothetical protein
VWGVARQNKYNTFKVVVPEYWQINILN